MRTAIGWLQLCLRHCFPENLIPPNLAPKFFALLRLQPVRKFYAQRSEGRGESLSPQGWLHQRRIALPARHDPAQSIHQTLEHTLSSQ
jgi:hypothetical protein